MAKKDENALEYPHKVFKFILQIQESVTWDIVSDQNLTCSSAVIFNPLQVDVSGFFFRNHICIHIISGIWMH